MSFHAAQTFTYGEQPSATKWQYIWDNDYALADGSGITTGVIIARHFAANAIENAAIKAGELYASKLYDPYKFRAYRNAAANTGNGAFAVLATDTEQYDTSNNLASGVFTAPVAGWYFFRWQVQCTCDGTARYVISALFINGAEYSRGSQGKVTASTIYASVGSDLVYMAAGATADVRAYAEVTLALSVGNISSNTFSGGLFSAT